MADDDDVRLTLRLDAPFAACRPFVAGWYRPAAPFLTHSAVYGLLLNVAGVESRLWEHEPSHDGRAPASLTRDDVPAMRVALGVPGDAALPRVETMFQQLHNYPVGKDAGMPAAISMGRKNNISPVRRELLCGVHAIVAIACEAAFAERLRAGLRGEPSDRGYGLPFLGDNSFLIDRLDEIAPRATRWYARVEPGQRPRAGTARLTSHVDRADMSRTRSELFAPADAIATEPPTGAWAAVGGPGGGGVSVGATMGGAR